MCSMGFAPKSGGEVPPYSFTPPEIRRVNMPDESFNSIKLMAYDFWERVANDERISDEFRAFLDRGNPIDGIIRNI